MDSMFKFRDARHADALHRATQYIRTHLGDHLDLNVLSGAACLSPSYFSRIFREETGISVQQAVMDARLKRACELIEYGGLRLSDIALMVGFQDQSYFSRAFQKAYGVTPTQYKRSHQK
jgi:AraC-like DNA-binding protein